MTSIFTVFLTKLFKPPPQLKLFDVDGINDDYYMIDSTSLPLLVNFTIELEFYTIIHNTIAWK